jgi:hypothetical protein
LKNTRHALYGTLNLWKIQGIHVIDKNGSLQSPLAPFVEWVSLMYVAASEYGERSKVKCKMKNIQEQCAILPLTFLRTGFSSNNHPMWLCQNPSCGV